MTESVGALDNKNTGRIETGEQQHGGVKAIITEWGAGWKIGLAAFLAVGLSQGAYQAMSSLFVMPLQEAFGWTRGEIALAFNASLVVALVAPFFGRMVDRLGPRRIMLFGMLMSIASYLGLASQNGSLALFYALHVFSAVVGLSASGLTCSRVISQHFVQSRGFSLAVARSGMSFANAVLPMLLYAVIANFGWRAGYATQAALVLIVALPAVYLWIDRAGNGRCAAAAPSRDGLLKWTQLLKNPRVWLLCLGAGLGYAPATAIMSQMQPLLVAKGIEASTAAGLVGIAGLSSFAGALITGLLVDRFWAPAIALLFGVGSCIGTLLLALNGMVDGTTATAAIMLIGLGLGAEIDVVAFIAARYFGVRNFSTVYGMAVLGIAFSGALGATMLGITYDRMGDYDAALLVIAAAFLAAGFVYVAMGRYPAKTPGL